ncbi:hypothetical protein FWC31_01030 [Candidatus Saccharibacteria bacterium]|nr:hypothetical protein [Candidatus Saccharibacteria bacterium]
MSVKENVPFSASNVLYGCEVVPVDSERPSRFSPGANYIKWFKNINKEAGKEPDSWVAVRRSDGGVDIYPVAVWCEEFEKLQEHCEQNPNDSINIARYELFIMSVVTEGKFDSSLRMNLKHKNLCLNEEDNGEVVIVGRGNYFTVYTRTQYEENSQNYTTEIARTLGMSAAQLSEASVN